MEHVWKHNSIPQAQRFACMPLADNAGYRLIPRASTPTILRGGGGRRVRSTSTLLATKSVTTAWLGLLHSCTHQRLTGQGSLPPSPLSFVFFVYAMKLRIPTIRGDKTHEIRKNISTWGFRRFIFFAWKQGRLSSKTLTPSVDSYKATNDTCH